MKKRRTSTFLTFDFSIDFFFHKLYVIFFSALPLGLYSANKGLCGVMYEMFDLFHPVSGLISMPVMKFYLYLNLLAIPVIPLMEIHLKRDSHMGISYSNHNSYTTNPKYYFLKMSTSKDIPTNIVRRQRTDRGQINVEGLNVNIFGCRHFYKKVIFQSCYMIRFLSIS